MQAKGKIAFVVGHTNWGKSTTLRALTHDNFRLRWHSISGFDFFIRRMSNDDYPDSYIDFMRRITPTKYDHLIAAMCPEFNSSENPTETILLSLQKKGFELYFWVLEKEQGHGERTVRSSEILTLRKHGVVEIHDTKTTPQKNAKLFSKFISDRVLK